ncbi:hypothetical protein [Flavicella sp.]|uniref:hypothetical protein n=1 Tax=Flavicella sp. TaxID=2957742 RepID=UPI0026350860|nr:hypothetical protein [Flavicella sp.]MDG1804343.1 hypothetical protein [Flavicella sp.]
MLNKLLTRLKLIQKIEIIREKDKTEKNLDKIKEKISDDYFFLPPMFDSLFSNDSEYLGFIANNTISIRKKVKAFNGFQNMTKVSGNYSLLDENTYAIKLAFSGMSKFGLIIRIIVFCIFLLISFASIVEAILSPEKGVFLKTIGYIFIFSIIIYLMFIYRISRIESMNKEIVKLFD